MRESGCLPFLLAALVLAFACAPDPGNPGNFHLLVFPAEAELGGSAAAVISSNYVPGDDADEIYNLDRSRVTVTVKDSGGIDRDATVRAVFPLAASRTSHLAEAMPGVWATVVLFDLPTVAGSGFVLGTPPLDAAVTVAIDTIPVTDPRAVGSIRLTGSAGQPTAVLAPPLSDLEYKSLVMRLRPVLDDGSGVGFQDGAVIAGLEADLIYLNPCLENFRVYGGTEAANANVHLGPLISLGGFVWTTHLTLSDPDGFTLSAPAGGSSTALGQGPLIDMSFDRPNQTAVTCVAIPLFVQNVYAVGPDGSVLADERGMGTFGENSGLFTLHVIATE